jgi:hypothetical protein
VYQIKPAVLVQFNFIYKFWCLLRAYNHTMDFNLSSPGIQSHDFNLHSLAGFRGDCSIWSFENEYFSFVEMGMGKNSPVETLKRGSGKKHPSSRIPRIRPLLDFFTYFLYLKILGIYFTIYYEIFWLLVLYDYTYFFYTLWNVLAMMFRMIISSQMLLHCFFWL